MTENSREWQDGFVYVIEDDGTESWQPKRNFQKPLDKDQGDQVV